MNTREPLYQGDCSPDNRNGEENVSEAWEQTHTPQAAGFLLVALYHPPPLIGLSDSQGVTHDSGGHRPFTVWARTAALHPVVFVLLSAPPRRSASSSLAFPLPFSLSACSALPPSHLPFLPSSRRIFPLPSLSFLFPGLPLLLFLFPSLLFLLLLTVLAAASTCFTSERS